MADLSIQFRALHHIDLNADSITSVAVSKEARDINEYISELLEKVTSEKNKRLFDFASETSEVRAAISKIVDKSSFEEGSQIIANRLLRIEKETQERYDQITDIHKGSLLQALLTHDGTKTFIITKVDHNAFLDEADLRKRVGLPFERRVLKAVIVEISDDGEITKTDIYDSNTSISSYWWKYFLELMEIDTDYNNTKTSFNAIDSVLNRHVKKTSPSDYTFLRNNVVAYYRTQLTFNLDDLLSSAIGSYEPMDSRLDLEDLKEKILSLPEKKKFDRRFNIERKAVSARFRRVIALHEKIDLDLKEDIENLEEIITPYEDKTGEKFISIKSESGYYAFLRRN